MSSFSVWKFRKGQPLNLSMQNYFNCFFLWWYAQTFSGYIPALSYHPFTFSLGGYLTVLVKKISVLWKPLKYCCPDLEPDVWREWEYSWIGSQAMGHCRLVFSCQLKSSPVQERLELVLRMGWLLMQLQHQLWSSSLALSAGYFCFLNAASTSQVVDAELSSTCSSTLT